MSTLDVRVTHPDYAAASQSIMAARDCYLGERAVKSRADLYLPRLTGQNPTEYVAYKMRATFFSIVGRTVSALTGLAVQGEVQVKGNQETVSQMADTEHGMQLFEANNMSVSELLLQGRIGFLLDAPAQAKTVGVYAYVSDAIINWDVDATGAYTMVVLKETRLVPDVNNKYKKTMEAQYRVLELVNGVYTVSLYDKDSKPLSSVQPSFMGRTIDYIPFFTALPTGLGAGVTKSPMEDMVNVNLSHYRTSADLEHGRHFVGLPTPVVSGAEVNGKLKVGGTQAWVLPEKDAKAYYLEFKGEGLKSLETALKEKEGQLDSLATTTISKSVRGSESPEALRLRLSSETASLFTIVKTTQALQTKIWNTKAELEGNPKDITMTYPTRFVSGQLGADEIQLYSKTYLSGALPLDDYVAIMRSGGVLSADRTDDMVKADLKKIADEMAAAAAATPNPNQPKA